MSKIIDFFKAAGKGKQQQFEALLRPHVPLLYKKALLWTGTHEDAEDLLQDVLVKLAGRIDTMCEIDKLAPWLLKITYRQFVDHYRKEARSPLVTESTLATSDPDDADREAVMNVFPDEFDAFAGVELRDELVRAIESLSPELRMVFILLEYKGYAVEEVAAMLQVKPGTVKSRNHRAKSQLKKMLGAGTFATLPSC